MTKILDLIVANHCDASETLSPTGVGGDIETAKDRKQVRDAFYGKVGMIGGMDQFHILEDGSREEIEKMCVLNALRI